MHGPLHRNYRSFVRRRQSRWFSCRSRRSFSLYLRLSESYFIIVVYQRNASVSNAYDRSIAASVSLSLFPLAPLKQLQQLHSCVVRIRRNGGAGAHSRKSIDQDFSSRFHLTNCTNTHTLERQRNCRRVENATNSVKEKWIIEVMNNDSNARLWLIHFSVSFFPIFAGRIGSFSYILET